MGDIDQATRTGDGPTLKLCAACGISDGSGGAKLKKCTACKSVWYCGVSFQKEHRKVHYADCKRIEKELKELGDLKKSVAGLRNKLAPALAELTLESAGTAKDHGLVGDDCPHCLDPLPPFWEMSRRYTYMCCGKACCVDCRKMTVEHVREVGFNKVRRQIEELERNGGGVLHLSEDMNENVSENDTQQYRLCPFCRTPHVNMEGIFTKQLKGVLAKNAENGYPWAQYILGICHVGLGRSIHPGNDLVDVAKRKKSRGMDLLHLAAKHGYPLAIYQLAQMYRNQSGGIERCMELGNHLMRLAAQQGHGLAGLIVYRLFEDDGDFEMAKKYLKGAHLAGSGEASFLIGYDYHTGSNGVTKDLSTALEYYKLGAERGQADAQWGAAELSRKLVAKGKVGEEDEIKYLRMAAEQGHTGAQCLLGTVLLKFGGEWTRGDTWSEGVRWLRRAKSGGDSTAAMRLETLKSDTGNLCFNCGAKATEAEKFSRCSKCLASYYCSRTCQKEHWHSSHKNHCVKHDEPLPPNKMKMDSYEAAGFSDMEA